MQYWEDEALVNELKDRINAMRRAFYEKNADEINAQKRAAYALRVEREENDNAE